MYIYTYIGMYICMYIYMRRAAGRFHEDLATLGFRPRPLIYMKLESVTKKSAPSKILSQRLLRGALVLGLRAPAASLKHN